MRKVPACGATRGAAPRVSVKSLSFHKATTHFVDGTAPPLFVTGHTSCSGITLGGSPKWRGHPCTDAAPPTGVARKTMDSFGGEDERRNAETKI